ncbi:MAG: hypothetical protein DI629_15550 [Mesorhizobium amorphae]|nr:MAG: hypothetical protein DI629_15550 [Mesorhizobium amorphae]
MSLAWLGAGLGLALALAELLVIRALSRRVDLPETRQALRVAAMVQIVLFPVAGWFILPLVFGD